MKILALDIETAPNIAYTWGTREQNISDNQIVQEGYILCWCASWLHDRKVMSDGLINHPRHYKSNPTCDKKISQSIWKLLDEADAVLTQNGDRFDLRWLNEAFLIHKLGPPSDYKSIDTLKQSRRHFKSASHKLDYRGMQLGIGRKTQHEGFELWTKCMDGDKSAWAKMIKYCKNDVILLKNYYLELRPYIKNHPNMAPGFMGCPNCGSKNLTRRGYSKTNTNKYQRYRCNNCGKWSKDSKPVYKRSHSKEMLRGL